MLDRRELMIAGAALTGSAFLPRAGLSATPDRAAMDALLKGAMPNRGRIVLTIPAIAENGLSVFTAIEVESPMTATDHVRSIHLFSERNPLPRIASFHLGPRAGRAKIATNIRLAASQRVTAIAEMSDGSFWFDEKAVIVTIGACIDGG